MLLGICVMEEIMKYIVALSAAAVLFASPAFAGGGKGIALVGSVVAPITTAVSALNVNALNNVSVLSGNSTNVSPVTGISLKNTSLLSGILGGGASHGCGCN
jgi:hypothetical protein